MKNLFQETQIGSLKLKNRFWRSATWMNMADEKGHLTPRLEKVYLDLAKGGVASIITGYAFVMKEEQPNPGMMGIYDDSFIAEYKELTDKVHTYGANIIMQIVYGGSNTGFNTENREIWGASAVANPRFGTIPVEMTQENIDTLIDAFALAAKRVKQAGFDGVQLHGAHAYLLSQFLSPYYNRRTDQYGGPIENRARIIFEILESVRRELGPDYPVLIKLHCSDEWGEMGLTEKESLYVAKELEKRGITAIEFSGGNVDAKNHPNKGPIRAKILKPEAQSYFAEKTAKIAKNLNVPVISVGGHRDPLKMKELLNSTSIEYFALCRVLFSEPDIINRWQNKDYVKPRCVSCLKCFDKDGNVCVLDRKKK